MTRLTIATSLSSFEGIEEPKVRFVVARDCFEPDDFLNISEVDGGVFRMTLRHHAGEWWDGDRDTCDKTRQRAEVKGLGRHQALGESFEYSTTWRGSPLLHGTKNFCHIFQLKATQDSGPPLVTLSILPGTGQAAVKYRDSTTDDDFIVRTFDWTPSIWQSVKIRIKPSDQPDGEVTVSINNDPFLGKQGLILHRPTFTDYRPKWGFYRRINNNLRNGEDFIEHKDVSSLILSIGSES